MTSNLAWRCLLLSATLAAPALAEEVTLPHLTVSLPGPVAERSREDRCDGRWGPCHSTWVVAKSPDGSVRRVVLLEPKRPATAAELRQYLPAWKRSHGCKAKQTSRFAASTRGGWTPPQLTFEGVCEGGDHYRIRVLVLDGIAYELHVDMQGGGVDERALDAAFWELLAAVKLHE